MRAVMPSKRQHNWSETSEDLPFSPQWVEWKFFIFFQTLFVKKRWSGAVILRVHGICDTDFLPKCIYAPQKFDAGFESTDCSTVVNLHQIQNPGLSPQVLFSVASVTSLLNIWYHSKTAILWRKPLKVADSVVDDFWNVHRSRGPLNKCNFPVILPQGDVREWLWM